MEYAEDISQISIKISTLDFEIIITTTSKDNSKMKLDKNKEL